MSKKVAVLSAAAALAVPGVAQASHESGKAGAPGQVCKPLKVAKKLAVKGKKGKERAALTKTFNAAYKGCIQEAVKARQADQAPASDQAPNQAPPS